MVNPIQKETAYRLYLMAKIREWYREGRGDFTVLDLAAYAGLNPTGNMYRQLRSFIEDGSLELTNAYKKSGFRQNVYVIVSDPAMVGK